MLILEKSFIILTYLNIGISIHPHLLGRPVVAPNSPPIFYKLAPISFCNSVGNAPSPTLVK